MTGLILPAALTLGAVALWATGRLPDILVALGFFALAMALGVAPAEVVFSGFASSAFWLVLGGFVLGIAIRKVGLADRAARALSARLGVSWVGMVAGVVLLTYALAFVMPSNMGRIALLMPVVMALAARAGLEPGSPGRAALALAVGFGTYQLSCSILPANVPNLIMAGAVEATHGITLSYLPYLVLHAPVLGVLKAALLVVLIAALFPAAPRAAPPEAPPPPISRDERRLALLLLATLALWATDSLHGIAPAWVGLGAACLCLAPRVGVVTAEEFVAGVNWRVCLYLAGILGVAAVFARSGLGDAVGGFLAAHAPLSPDAPFTAFAALVGITAVLGAAVTTNGVPALFTPLAGRLAEASGLPLETVLMTQVIAYATPPLPYMAAPIVVAMGMGGVSARDGARLCLAVAAVTALVLLPLDYLWFRVLGRLG